MLPINTTIRYRIPRISALLVIICLFTTFNLKAQNFDVPHVPDVLMVKFEHGQYENTLLKTGRYASEVRTQAQNRVQNLISGKGGKVQPFLNEQRLRALEKQTGLQKSRAQQARGNRALEELKKTYRINLPPGSDLQQTAIELRKVQGVAYVEPKYIRHTTAEPNDTLASRSQLQYQYQNFFDAWDLSKGDESVLIAIIDTGVDYTHPDLDDKIWINEDETPNNGVDDDGNGYVDDYRGYDFWDSGTRLDDIEEDTDPIGDYNDHGTHVAGIAAAETDNTTGVAGTGWDARYMAVKVGGAQGAEQSIGFGYEGILYAAQNGADIINCSWGGQGVSQFERDIINAATSMGSVIIAAAGNSGSETQFYPASFSNVLSVGSVDPDDTKASYSNYHYSVDVMATGSGIYSTTIHSDDGDDSNDYVSKNGTSMAAPFVSGLAALIKSEHPSWSPMQIMAQIRSTAKRIDSSNPSEMEYKLGKGVIDAEAALGNPKPGIIIHNPDIVNEEGQKLDRGESGFFNIDLANYGSATDNLTLNLISNDDNVTVNDGQVSVGSLNKNDTTQASFEVSLPEEYDLTNTPSFIIEMEDAGNGYTDFYGFNYDKLLYDNIVNKGLIASIAANGTIGFAHPLASSGGVGFIPRIVENGDYMQTSNILFEGGLILQSGDTTGIADQVRENTTQSNDFKPVSTFQVSSPGEEADVQGTTDFNTSNTNKVSRMNISKSAYAYQDQGLENVLFLKYEITNPSWDHEDTIHDLRVGLFNDWDLGNAYANEVDYSAEDSLLYVFDTDTANSMYAAAVPMGNLETAFAINNAYQGEEDTLNFSIYGGTQYGTRPGFSDYEKYHAMTAGLAHTSAGPSDVSAMVATGPYTIGRRSTVTTGFIYAWGKSLDQLKTQISNARARQPFRVDTAGLHVGVEDRKQGIPQRTRLHPAYPNPFNPSTTIRIDLARSEKVSLKVFNILGQQVGQLVNKELSAGTHTYRFDATGLSSGVYIVRLTTPNATRVQKIQLIK